jgi:hypothetical protein
MVLVGPNAEPTPEFVPSPYRTPEAQWEARYKQLPDMAMNEYSLSPNCLADKEQSAPADPMRLTPGEIEVYITQFLYDHGALLRIHDAGELHGILRVHDVGGYNEANQVPSIMISNADYGRIARALNSGATVKLRVNAQNDFFPEGKIEHNAIGEISGTDKKDEVVMIGGHLDSWPAATGATDNGAGSAITLEAMRLLATLAVKPRRTIRVALWGGEEQGLLGSQAYVTRHFGDAEHPKPEFTRLAAYINEDGGTGKVRAAKVFGPPGAAQFVAQALGGFKGWGFVDAITSKGRDIGNNDHSSFSHAGLPSVNLDQDPFDYVTHTHHSNFDTYEAVYEPDMRAAAVEVAALAHTLAMADDMPLRFDKSAMPQPGRGQTLPERNLPAAQRGKRAAPQGDSLSPRCSR